MGDKPYNDVFWEYVKWIGCCLRRFACIETVISSLFMKNIIACFLRLAETLGVKNWVLYHAENKNRKLVRVLTLQKPLLNFMFPMIWRE